MQAYNFRLIITTDPDNRIPFSKPAGYNPQEYVLLSRYIKAGMPEAEAFRKFDPIQNSFSRPTTATPPGATSLTAAEFRNPGGLMVKFKNAGGPLTKWLKEQFPADLQAQINAYDSAQPLSAALVTAVAAELNRLIQAGPIYDAELFSRVNLPADVKQQATQNLEGEARARRSGVPPRLAAPDPRTAPGRATSARSSSSGCAG